MDCTKFFSRSKHISDRYYATKYAGIGEGRYSFLTNLSYREYLTLRLAKYFNVPELILVLLGTSLLH